MAVPDMLLEVIDRRVSRAVSRNKTTDHATVTAVSPSLTVTFDGDTAAVPMLAADGLTLTVGDVVGLTRFGSRWYATHVLKGA